MTTTEPIDEAWTAHRPYLLDLAFRMLGNLGDAEDAVQDAYARLLPRSHDSRYWIPTATLVRSPASLTPAR